MICSKENAKDAIFYSYTRHINGFAAILDEEVALAISNSPGVISVFENKKYELHTTRSWQFLGLERDGDIPQELWEKAKFGEDVIIGNIDSGVWPESESFRDEDMGPIPSRWKGICQKENDAKFSCNRKLIGTRSFFKGFESYFGNLSSNLRTPRDTDGHGTHTLSTAGGSPVHGANVLGFGNGTAKGGSPRARVASYKACWSYKDYDSFCFDADILAAFDAAIYDGVDVLSVSLGGYSTSYFDDGIAIGAFHAILNGISVVASAGNSGPDLGTVKNVAPWLLTVGASTIDRDFPAYVIFGKHKLKGQSLSDASLQRNEMLPLIRSRDAAAANASYEDANVCLMGSLDATKVRGKIVVCVRGWNYETDKSVAVKLVGGKGMVLVNSLTDGNDIFADLHVLPATHISDSDALKLFSYLNSTKSPMGTISYPITMQGTKPAPLMAPFSSHTLSLLKSSSLTSLPLE
ncbi:hypothetical protein HPP92_027281 [Vanilla planifolia]|uniref:Uncharacterized protein n=1 Tax=Vanilla planifolia TaxID=51239 RepID=A0A835P9P9_VANPL|nr:hypothetical protein HPP92_027281 [Vanilla planifolia]